MVTRFLTDAWVVAVGAAVIVVIFVLVFRFLWRRGKDLEDP